MDIQDIFKKLRGTWEGDYTLIIYPGADPSQSSSTATIQTRLKTTVLEIGYSWVYEEKDHEGLLIFAYHPDKELLTTTWTDTWHMANEFMNCKGLVTKNSELNVFRIYNAGKGPDWAWRTVLRLSKENKLSMKMFNITPEGQETLAVESLYESNGSF